jgi:hypothetical protein
MTVAGAMAFGIAAVAYSLGDNGTIWRGLMWAAAWSSVGWFLGFLFGIPRFLSTDTARKPESATLASAKQDYAKAAADAKTLRDDATKLADPAAVPPAPQAQLQAALASATKAEAAADAAKQKLVDAAATAPATSGSSLTVNTNLEQISDWLTKIVVGVSLVESQALLGKMQSAATLMAKSFEKIDQAGRGEAVPRAADAAASAASAAVASTSSAASAVAHSASAAASGVVHGALTGLQQVGAMESLAYAVMLYFLATGLLGSYLLTRLFLQQALTDAAHPQDA